MARDIILTGIPRSGTTLAASLLEAEPNTVCLNEPEWHRPHPSLDASGFVGAIATDFLRLREKLLAGTPVPDRRAENGAALTNYYESGTKTKFVIHDLLRPGLPPDFTLAIKHNAPYLAVLPELIALGRFDIRAVIRHPLPVIRSWRRLDLPISRGELPNAVAYWPEIKALVQASMPLLEKQARILELMVTRIMEHQSHITVLRYESIRHSASGIQEAEKETAEDTHILDALTRHAPVAMGYCTQ